MTGEWLLTMKPSFLGEMTALGAAEAGQITKKLELLSQDPRPDAKTKKQLKGWGGKLHRLRSGDFRVFYTFETPHVSLLALRRKEKDTYDEEMDEELLGAGDVSVPQQSTVAAWDRWLAPPAKTPTKKPLIAAITQELLEALKIEARWRARLVAIETEDDLLDADDVPEAVRLRVMDALVERPLEEVKHQPNLVLDEPADLLRYREGGLLSFLLQLDADQEKLVPWAAGGGGPTLLKGAPGTGKSTVALYRARLMLQRLRERGIDSPRLLFTTYTTALVRFSEQLLESLLGADAKCVQVRTVDSVAVEIAREVGVGVEIVPPDLFDAMFAEALASPKLLGNSLVQAAQRRTLQKLGAAYVREEVLQVIVGRGLTSLEAYQAAGRPGRQVALGASPRGGVWRVWEGLASRLATRKLQTWETLRAEVASACAAGRVSPRYDGVLIDEAQDLSPASIRILVSLCKHPGSLFLTADANQSIYGAGFRWTDVHESLRFQGRTGVLRSNHRSTRELGEAADSFLSSGALDTDVPATRYVHSGPFPAVRRVGALDDEARLIATFFRAASRDLRMGLGACAVLCPTNDGARRIASELGARGVHASYAKPRELDITAAGAKTLTLKSAKGLEFPIVALAGFGDSPFPFISHDASDEERAEITERERRTLFVAMTRAMRALLVVVPGGSVPPILSTFDGNRWNLGGA